MTMDRGVRLGGVRFYYKLLRFVSTRWSPLGSRADDKSTIMLVFRR